ncbi:MAG TPA: ribonuclease H-like domain-containing protein [Acidobacteriota bacterium]|nr:ribonuclease H-like domain-containing protein [Acidobacteriota bacterium]
MDLKSRLQQLYGSRPAADSDLRKRLERLHRRDMADIAEHLEGYWHETSSGSVIRVEKEISPFYLHGDQSFDPIWELPETAVSLLAGDPAFAAFDISSTLFLDTETTGLAGGAGTYPFLIGIGFFVNRTFRIVQFFLPDFESEHAFLSDFSDLVSGQGPASDFKFLVTFNGKSFDLSLLENRFVLQRLENPCRRLLHLDLLHPCRLLWRDALENCSLQTLERHVLNYDRFPDLPSHLIPISYFNYLHWGEFGPLREVLEHNRRDIISMAVLLGIAGRCVTLPEASPAVDAVSLARFHYRRGRLSDAASYFERSLDDERCVRRRAEVLYNLARLRRRLGEDDAALELCLALIREDPFPPLQAFEEAAKILEHRKRAFQQALDLVSTALTLYPNRPELERRRFRLTCRLEGKKWY